MALLGRAGARVRTLVLVVVAAAWCAGCWSATAESTQPRDGRAGLQLAGSIAGRQLAVSDGAPRLVVGDCDPDVSGDADVCAIGDDIDGTLVVVVFENPDVLEPGATLPVADPGCTAGCDDVTDVAVVDVQVGTGERRRAVDGSVEVTEVVPFSRYAGQLRLTLPSGSVAGSFDLVPRSD